MIYCRNSRFTCITHHIQRCRKNLLYSSTLRQKSLEILFKRLSLPSQYRHSTVLYENFSLKASIISARKINQYSALLAWRPRERVALLLLNIDHFRSHNFSNPIVFATMAEAFIQKKIDLTELVPALQNREKRHLRCTCTIIHRTNDPIRQHSQAQILSEAGRVQYQPDQPAYFK